MSTVTGLSRAQEINDTIEQTFYLEQKIYEYQNIVNKNKAKISKEVGRRRNLSIQVDKHTGFFVSKKVIPDIKFFPEKLKEKIKKKHYQDVVDKTVYVNDLDGLINLLKEYGVSPKKFKKYISTDESVINDEITRLIDIGEIDIEQIQGCYSVNFDEEIKIKKTK